MARFFNAMQIGNPYRKTSTSIRTTVARPMSFLHRKKKVRWPANHDYHWRLARRKDEHYKVANEKKRKRSSYCSRDALRKIVRTMQLRRAQTMQYGSEQGYKND